MQEGHFPDQKNYLLHDSLSKWIEGQNHIHGLCIGPLHATKPSGQDHGRI